MKKYLAVYGKPRYLGIISCEEDIQNGDQILVESVRGEDIAISVGILNDKQETEYRALRNTVDRGDNTPKTTEPAVTDLRYIRPVSGKELNEQMSFREEEKDVLKKAKELVIPHELDMKLIDVEYLTGRQKLFFYFSAEQRVDFRAYVRDLAREFRTRIELRQIGVRDEARIVGGIGLCGNRCCCSYWLHQFEPVGIKMVKEQNLALNPAKISGICGRLMCCMCYEENVYHELWEGLPNPGTKIKTESGNIVVTGINVPKKAVKCYIPEHGEKDVPIEKFEEFEKAVTSDKGWDVIERLIVFEDPCEHCSIFDESKIFFEKQKPIVRIYTQQMEEQTKAKEEQSSKHKRKNLLDRNKYCAVKEAASVIAEAEPNQKEQRSHQMRHSRFNGKHRINRRRKSRDAE